MSLYNHVANKDDMIDGIVDIVFSEIEPPATGSTGSAMRERAISTREALSRHRWAVGLMESRMSPDRRTSDSTTRCSVVCGRQVLGRDGRPRVLGSGQLHLRVRAPGERLRASAEQPAGDEQPDEDDASAASADDYPYIAETVGGT